MTGKMCIAIPTKGHSGINDEVSGVFSRAKTFTLVEVVDGKPHTVEVLENEAAGLSQGAGPLAVKILKDREVDLVISSELGPGASTLMETIGIETMKVQSGLKVTEAMAEFLKRKHELYA